MEQPTWLSCLQPTFPSLDSTSLAAFTVRVLNENLPYIFKRCLFYLFALVTASPNLVARQGGCESVFCWPDFSDDFDSGSSLGALWQLFRGDPLLPGAPPDDTKTIFNTPGRVPGPEQSPVETYVIAPPDECDAAQASDPHAFSGDTGPSTCEAATGLLVWTRDCTDGGENTRIEEILRGMDSKTLTSTDPLC